MFAQVVAPAFFRREPRLRARSYLLGLVSGLQRANGWTLAEFAGDATPDGMQRLLSAARWDEDAVLVAVSSPAVMVSRGSASRSTRSVGCSPHSAPRPTRQTITCTGLPGGDVTKSAPGTAITSDNENEIARRVRS